MMTDYVGVIPAAGLASRLGPLGYPKELLPITYVPGEGGHLRPLPVIEASLRQLREAGVGRALVITSDRKPELMQYLAHGGGIGLDLAFLQQARAEGLAAAMALALPWTKGANTCLLLPDTIVRPEAALKEARALFESAQADLVLGVLPTDKPKELGPVRFDDAMRVIEVQDKPAETDLANSWAMAIWGPAFAERLGEAVARNPSQTLGAVFQQAVDAGLDVRAAWFPGGAFYDVGTPKGLAEALPQFLKGL
jgi:glucose-1-phosphate thymidylyltransferase